MDNGLFIYINHIRNLQGNVRAWFKDILNMEICEWIILPFDTEMESVNLDSFLNEKFMGTVFDQEAKFMYTFIENEYN